MGSYVAQYQSANAIIRALQGRGLGYRRQTMLDDIRQINGLAKLEMQVLNIPSSQLFPQFGMVESYLRRARKYRVYVRVSYEDIESGEITESMASFYTDERKSKDAWEQDFSEMFPESESGKMYSLSDARIASVEHQRGFSY